MFLILENRWQTEVQDVYTGKLFVQLDIQASNCENTCVNQTEPSENLLSTKNHLTWLVQKFLVFYWTLRMPYISSYLHQINPVTTLLSYFLMIYFNNILPPRSKSSQRPFSTRFPTIYYVNFSSTPLMSYSLSTSISLNLSP